MDILVSLTLLSFFIETKALQSELMENKLGKNLCQLGRICRSEAPQGCILDLFLFSIFINNLE